MKVLVASGNPGKILQWKKLFSESSIEVVFPKDLGISLDVVEDGKTPSENALKKARAYYNETGIASIGDDSGIEFDFLEGEPGVKARRWMGRFPDSVSDEEWLSYLLSRMEGVSGKKTGKICACWALVSSNGEDICEFVLNFKLRDKPVRPYNKGNPLGSLCIFTNDLGECISKDEKFEILKKKFIDFKIEEKI